MDSKQDESSEPSGSGPPEDDDGGGGPSTVATAPGAAAPAEVDEMAQRFSQQQLMISQLKEMVLAEESARTQKLADTRLKVEKYTSQLAKIRERSRGNKASPKSPSEKPTSQPIKEASAVSKSYQQPTTIASPLQTASPSAEPIIDTPSPLSTMSTKSKLPSRETTKILHQQIKEHKAMIAERAKNELELEKALKKIQKQLEDSQNSDFKVTPAKVSQSENSESNKIISELRNRVIQLEGTILDLQETCKEKDAVIKSKADAITLLSADLSKKGKNTLDLLDDTKEQMHKMQENFITMENNMKLEKQSLLNELEACRNKITHLEEANSILEGERFKLSVENNTLEEKLLSNAAKIQNLQLELLNSSNRISEFLSASNIKEIDTSNEEKGTIEVSQMQNLTKKVEELEKINAALKETNETLEKKITDHKIVNVNVFEDDSTAFTDSNPDNKKVIILSTLHSIIDSLNKQILDLEISINLKSEKFDSLKTESNIVDSTNIFSTCETDFNNPNKELLEKIRLLEEMNAALKKCNTEIQLELSNEKSKSPEKSSNSPSPKAHKKFNKQPAKGKKGPTKPVLDESKLELVPEKNEFLESIIRLGSTVVNLYNDVATKKSQLEEKERHFKIIQEKEKSTTRAEIVPFEPDIIHSDIPDKSENLDMLEIKSNLDAALKEIEALKKDLADSNKNMIKLKAAHKTQIKQMQKCIDDYSKVSDSNSEVIRLQSEVNTLVQRIAELEDDKGNLQLHLVDYDSGRVSDSQLHAKLLDLERIAEERLKAIADLEMQKFELVQELHVFKQEVGNLEDKLADLSFLENEHVTLEIKCAQIEEQLDAINSDLKSKVLEIETLVSEKGVLASTIENLHKEKSEISSKLELYIQENIDLIDRLDKLSAEKVSSAESIEMVESLTAQEKIEIERYQKQFSTRAVSEKDTDEAKEDSASQIEKSELQSKIELFSLERKEVMDKIEYLQMKNNELNIQLEQLVEENKVAVEQYNFIKNEKDSALNQIISHEEKINSINSEIEKLMKENIELKIELENVTKNKKVTEVVVSETIEIEDTIEKEVIEPSSSHLDSDNKVVDQEGYRKQEAIMKNVKKATKEILRLKNLLKQKDLEIANLAAQIEQYVGLKDINQQLFEYFNTANNNIKMFIVENIPSYNIEDYKFNESTLLDNNTVSDMIVFNEKSVKILKEELSNKKNYIIDIQSKYNDHEELAKTCENVMSYLECNISLISTVVSENEKEVESFRQDLNQCETYSEKVNYLFSDLQEKIKIVGLILKNNKKEIQDILNSKAIVEEELKNLQNKCTEKDEQLKEMHQDLDRFNNQLDRESQCNIEKMNAECENYRVKESEFKSKISELEAELNLKLNLYTNSQQSLADLSKAIDDRSNENNRLQSLINSLQSELQFIKTENSSLQSQSQESNNLQSQVVNLQNKLDEVASEKDSVTSHMLSLTAENNSLLSQNGILQAKLHEYDSQLQHFSKDNLSYLEKLEEKINECESLKAGFSKFKAVEDQLNEKQVEIKSLIEQLNELQNNNTELKSAHDAKNQERDAYTESLETDLNKHKDRICKLENKISLMETLEKKAKKLVMKIQEKDAAIAKKSDCELDLNKKIEYLESEMKLYCEKNNQMNDENLDLKHSLDNIQQERNNLLSSIEILKSNSMDYESKLLQLKEIEHERDSHLDKCLMLESTINKMSAEHTEIMKKKFAECESLESTIHAQTENFDIQIKEFKNQYKKIQGELSLNIQRLKELEKDNNELIHEVEVLTTEKNNFMLQIKTDSSNEDIVFQLQKEIDELNRTLHEKDAIIQDNLSKYLQHEEELSNIKSLKDLISKLEKSCCEKDKEIEKIDGQFKSCLLQLEEVIGVQQQLRAEQQKLTKTIDEKNCLIQKLENDMSSLKSRQIEIVNDDVIVQKNIPMQMASAASFFDSIEEKNDPNDLKYLEDQIITTETANQSTGNENPFVPMIRAFHHDPSMPMPSSQISEMKSTVSPAEEDVIKPRKTYECFEEHPNQDGEISAIHILKKSAVNRDTTDTSTINEKLQEFENRIKTLSEEKLKLQSDLAQSQSKTNKALIKLKEYKSRNDTLTKELQKLKSGSGFDILDTAIQEELSSQIKTLEEKIKEMKIGIEKEKQEKDNMKKRIDVLTTANEKLINMKEKQDIELQMCLSKNEALNKKIENAEWDNNDFVSSEVAVEMPKSDSELNIQSKESDGNDSLFELNEKNKRLISDIAKLEEMLSSKCQEIDDQHVLQKQYDCEIHDMKLDYANLKDSLSELITEKEDLKSQMLSLQKTNSELETKASSSSESETLFSEFKNNIEVLKKEIDDLRTANDIVNNEKQSILSKYNSLQSSLEELKAKNDALLTIEKEHKNEFNILLEERNKLNEKLLTVEKVLNELSQASDVLKKKYEAKLNELSEAKVDFENSLKTVKLCHEDKYKQLELDLHQKCNELEAKYMDTLDKYNKETEKNQLNDSELMKKLLESENKAEHLMNEIENLNRNYESKLTTETFKYDNLSTEFKKLQEEVNRDKQELENILLNLQKIQTEKTQLEDAIRLRDEDLLKYYNFEAMCNNRFNEYNAILEAKDIDISQKLEQIKYLSEDNSLKSTQLEEKIQEIQILLEKTQNYDNLVEKLAKAESDYTARQSEVTQTRMEFENDKSQVESALSETSGKVDYLENELRQKLDECKILNERLQEAEKLVDEEALQMAEMRSALEAQELEIVTLKENLAEQTVAFGKLQRGYSKGERHVSFSEDTKPGDDSVPTSVPQKSTGSEKPPARADLDLALYMLHQRDVRCEELTVELLQLLEERDTLQLKLSDAIRNNEELRIKNTPSPSGMTPQDLDPKDETVKQQIAPRSSDPESSSSDSPSKEELLETKLSQLHGVNQSRDVRLKDDRELRHRQMELLQRDVQNLPSEAVAQLREAHYTLSRDTQSTSTVLFNWLWGKTTPKVVDM